MNKIICILFYSLISRSTGHSCEDNSSIELKNATLLSNSSILDNGVIYPSDKVYTKEVNNETKTFGCLCEIKKCVSKCCPLGSVNTPMGCLRQPDKDILLIKGLNVSFMDSYRDTVNLSSEEFGLFRMNDNGMSLCHSYIVSGLWYIQEDGKLFIEIPTRNPPWDLLGPERYCVDTFIVEDATGKQNYQLDALVCFGEDQGDHKFVLNSSCMLVSCVFILATCAVYAWLPELRNLHGRVLMAYLLSLFVAFLFMSTMQILLSIDTIYTPVCSGLSFVIYFAFEAAFFWLNVMCFDIWWTFSGKRGLSLQRLSTRARFNAYAAYAFGCPTLLTIFLAALEYSGLPPHPWLPLLRAQGCFLYANARLIYLYGPMTILCVINMVFFVLTAIKLVQIKKQTAVLQSKESSSTHDTQRTDKQRLLLYVKLFIVMGINWILEVLSAIYPEAKDFWTIIDAYNVLIGVIIFFIFVCKRKIFRLIKKRYKQMRGDPMSRTQTTSSRTMSTKEEYHMGSIKNNK